LVHDLKHGTLNLAITIAKTSTSHGIDLVEEDNARLLGTCKLENLSNHASALTDVALDQL
jgi:hypothetical protein